MLDDMISSGGAMFALVEALHAKADLEAVYVAASHNLCLAAAHERPVRLHEEFAVKEVLVTNTIPQTEEFLALPFVRVLDVAGVLAEIIYCVHHNQGVGDRIAQWVRD